MRSSRNLKWSELKAGLLVISALAILAVAIIEIGANTGGFFSRQYNIYLLLDNTFGLRQGSQVRLSGLEIGNVKAVGFPADGNDKRLLVTIEINSQYKERIRKDSVATIRTIGLLGDKYLDISIGSPQYPVLQPESYIGLVQETQFTNVIASASTGLEGLNVVVGRLRDILGDVNKGNGTAGLLLKDPRLYNQLVRSASELNDIARDVKSGRGSAGRLLQDPRLYENLVAVSEKADRLVGRLDRGNLTRISEDDELYKNLKDVAANLKDVSVNAKRFTTDLSTGNISRLSADKEMYARFERTTERLDRISARLDAGTGSVGKLLKDDEMYDNMNRFFKDADELVTDMKKNPGKYVHVSVF